MLAVLLVLEKKMMVMLYFEKSALLDLAPTTYVNP